MVIKLIGKWRNGIAEWLYFMILCSWQLSVVINYWRSKFKAIDDPG